jgi:flagellar protein FlaG
MMDTISQVTDVGKNPQAVSNVKIREQTSPGQKKETPVKDVTQAVNDINNAFNSMNISRQFVIDKDLGQVVVKIMDTAKKEVIRQIPSEDAIRLSKNIREMVGLLFDSKL